MVYKRNKTSYLSYINDFTAVVDVICPNCQKKAVVKDGNVDESGAKATCVHCGFRRKEFDNGSGSNNKSWCRINFSGGPVDPYFRLPVWYSRKIGDNLLWGYNRQHLQFLEDFVSAKLRERNVDGEKANKSLGSRLPKWMTSAKNREEVLKALKIMQQM